MKTAPSLLNHTSVEELLSAHADVPDRQMLAIALEDFQAGHTEIAFQELLCVVARPRIQESIF